MTRACNSTHKAGVTPAMDDIDLVALREAWAVLDAAVDPGPGPGNAALIAFGRVLDYLEHDERRAERAEKERDALRKDAAALDWLDANNARFSMGWQVAQAPAGNAVVRSVIQLFGPPTRIRDAIRAAMVKEGGQ